MNDQITHKSKEMNNSGSQIYFDEFNFLEFIASTWAYRKMILSITGIFSLSAIIYALYLPNIFSSEALLTTVDDSDAGGGIRDLASRYSGLASAAGVSLPSSEESKADLIIATIQSRSFFRHLLTFDFVLPGLMAAEHFDLKTRSLHYDRNLYDSEKKMWVNAPPSYLEAYKIYSDLLEIDQDNRSGFIFLIFNHISPEFSYKFNNLIVNELNNQIRTRHLNESTIALDYLKSELSATSQMEVQQSISQLIEAQLKVQMLANIRNDYMIRAIDPAFLPEEKSAPRKTRIVILGTIIGLILGIFLSIVRHAFFENKFKNA